MKKYDYLIVGAGLFGATFAHEAAKANKKCLVIDKRNHIGGNIYTENIEGINVHRYGAHIFHTNNKLVWDYMNQFATFNNYINSPMAIYKDEVYNLPFNMNTFSKLWNIKFPQEAKIIIAKQVEESGIGEPTNLEEQAIKMVGKDIYEKLVKGYTEKQWGKKATELPMFIIKRLPVRFTYDNNYFNDSYQGIPIGGYTQIAEKMLSGAEVMLETDFFADKEKFIQMADKVVYTGTIDRYFDYCFGELEYRGLRFDTKILDTENYQGNAVINYTDFDVPYTRVIEHKHFEFTNAKKSVVSFEYSQKWKQGIEPYYPINDEKNNVLAQKYMDLAKDDKLILGGRLADYKYYDMDKVVEKALNLSEIEFKK